MNDEQRIPYRQKLDSHTPLVLDDAQMNHFIDDGFVKVPLAFPREFADECRSILWRDTGCVEADPTTWTKPVIRLGAYGQKPFARAANTPVLHQAFDQLVGPGRWRPRSDLGTFPIRFPSPDDPGDAGWHVDSSFPPDSGDTADYANWRINVTSKGRALLMLFFFRMLAKWMRQLGFASVRITTSQGFSLMWGTTAYPCES